MAPCAVPVGRRIVSRVVTGQKRAGKLSGQSKELETENFFCATDRLYDLEKLKFSFNFVRLQNEWHVSRDTSRSPWC